MIPTVKYNLGGCVLDVPVIDGKMIELPHDNVLDFGSFCGAGDGIGNWLVPEVLPGGAKISAACWLHDMMRALFPRTEENFIHHNILFRDNMNAVIDFLLPGIENINNHLAASQMAITYFGAVQKASHINYYT